MSEYQVAEYDKVLATAEAMQRQGGSFVKHLGAALMVADIDNRLCILTAFPEYYNKYRKIAEINNWYMED